MQAVQSSYDMSKPQQVLSMARADEPPHFAVTSRPNFLKLFYLFVMGSMLGYLVETVYCGILSGHYVYRGSLIYAPLSVVYGIGALALFFSMRKLDKRSKLRVFAVGALVGTVVEYFCSLFQELAFGTISWDYSQMPLNIGGRVCLLYGVFWGALALVWIYAMYPGFEKLMRKIPNTIGKYMAYVLLVYIILNATLSITAITRWQNRMQGVPANNWTALAMDHTFPDDYMERIYGSMISTMAPIT